jgi:uncharacterized protein (TIGR00156 family)
MKLNRWSALLAGALAVGLAASAYAQYQGPGSKAAKAAAQGPITTVADVLKRGRDDQRVTLTGNVVKKVGWEKYLFRDASGAIRIEIDDEVMPAEPFDDKTKVEITGEVERDFLQSVEIDVKAIRILK